VTSTAVWRDDRETQQSDILCSIPDGCFLNVYGISEPARFVSFLRKAGAA
jgi:hypothetical protein